MARKQTAILVTALGIVALAFAAGCGGDDTSSGGSPDSGPDGGVDVFVPPGPDTGPPPDGGPDGADGGCDFNAFVTGLITNHTNATDLPSTDLGDNCVDTHTPFPQTLFQ
jgi:hypothetical protein